MCHKLEIIRFLCSYFILSSLWKFGHVGQFCTLGNNGHDLKSQLLIIKSIQCTLYMLDVWEHALCLSDVLSGELEGLIGKGWERRYPKRGTCLVLI